MPTDRVECDLCESMNDALFVEMCAPVDYRVNNMKAKLAHLAHGICNRGPYRCAYVMRMLKDFFLAGEKVLV